MRRTQRVVSDLHRVRHTHSFFFLVDCFLSYRFCTGTVMAVRSLIIGSLRLIYGHTYRATPPYSLWFSVRYGCRKCWPVTALWQLLAVPLFLPLPFCHEFNPLTIASLRRVVAGLNRCGTFRFQQQVLHRAAETCVSVFLVVPLFLFVAQYRVLHPSGSIVPFQGYKVERVAFRCALLSIAT